MKCSLSPWQIVHKPGLAFGTFGRSCLADYFINGAALAQREIQHKKTKKEQQNNKKNQKQTKKLMILYRVMHCSGSHPYHHHISCPYNPTKPLILDCSCHPGNMKVFLFFPLASFL